MLLASRVEDSVLLTSENLAVLLKPSEMSAIRAHQPSIVTVAPVAVGKEVGLYIEKAPAVAPSEESVIRPPLQK